MLFSIFIYIYIYINSSNRNNQKFHKFVNSLNFLEHYRECSNVLFVYFENDSNRKFAILS